MNAFRSSRLASLLAVILLSGLVVAPLSASDADVEKKADAKLQLPVVFEKAAPETVADLKAIQEHVKNLTKKLIPCTVNLQIGASQGSGVIISEDGYVLTAGHVSGKPDQNCVITMHDGKKVKGKTLGANRTIDSGLVKITTEGKYNFIPMGDSAALKKGQWCMAIGHPGGFKKGRDPVVRLGRVLQANKNLVQTDCTLVGGDSGGPLFDMEGKVIGIHSRIGFSITFNIHVPVDTYRETWDKLAKGEAWGSGPGGSAPTPPQPYLGVETDPENTGLKITNLTEGAPAQKAGLLIGDVITKIGDKGVTTYDELSGAIRARKVGDMVAIEVQRGDSTIIVKVTLAKRPG